MRDGVLLGFAAEASGERSSALDSQTYASAENLGRRFQYDEQHAHQVAALACALFDALDDEHGLSRRERRLLKVAALLHDIGLFISSNSHHKHSEYIINASDIFGVRAEERAIVSAVARYHRRALPQASHQGFSSLPRRDRAVVAKLAAILRVADALDRSHGQQVRSLEARLGDEELVIRVDTDEDLSLERLAMRSKADLFEEVFGRTVVLQQTGA
jgi:exopolyphosphatase/guanosine-5'-triphosphate,3'-diphosphate pyrophosphatase